MNKQDRIILEKLYNSYGEDILLEKLNLSSTAKKAIAGTALAAGILYGVHNNHHRISAEPEQETTEQSVQIRDIIPNYDELVQAVKEYMSWAVNCINHTYDEIEIKPETVVELCYQYKYDLPMLLSALHLESAIGTTPRAKRTGSPCSVGCWDNGKNKVYYDDQNDAVEDYIKIMQNNFIRGRKMEDAFADGQLVNGLGLRYASSKSYEKDLRGMRARALRKFPNLRFLTTY